MCGISHSMLSGAEVDQLSVDARNHLAYLAGMAAAHAVMAAYGYRLASIPPSTDQIFFDFLRKAEDGRWQGEAERLETALRRDLQTWQRFEGPPADPEEAGELLDMVRVFVAEVTSWIEERQNRPSASDIRAGGNGAAPAVADC